MTRNMLPQPLYRLGAILVLATAFFMAASVSAQTRTSDDDAVEYVFKQNDTLLGLARKYFRRSANYRPIMRYNRITDDRRIPVGYTLKIPYKYLKYEESAGRITAFRGDAAISSGKGNTQQASVGFAIAEGNVLATGAASSLSMSFDDGSIVTMPSNSVIRITRLRKIMLTDSIDYEFALDRGGIRSKVTPFKQGNDRYRTRTPIAVSAVRGTDFRNRYDSDSAQSFAELVEGGLELAAPELSEAEINLETGFGAAAGPQGVVKAALLPGPEVIAGTGTQKREVIAFALAKQPKATGYRVQIAKDSGFIDIVKDEQDDDGTLSVTNLDNGNYFAKFTAFADNGLEGLPSTIVFKRRLNDVKASTSVTDTGYNFRWSGAGKGKRVYHFQLFGTPDKADGTFAPSGPAFVEQAGMRVDGITLSDLPPGNYYWRVGTQLFAEGEMDQSWTGFEHFAVE